MQRRCCTLSCPGTRRWKRTQHERLELAQHVMPPPVSTSYVAAGSWRVLKLHRKVLSFGQASSPALYPSCFIPCFMPCCAAVQPCTDKCVRTRPNSAQLSPGAAEGLVCPPGKQTQHISWHLAFGVRTRRPGHRASQPAHAGQTAGQGRSTNRGTHVRRLQNMPTSRHRLRLHWHVEATVE